MFYEHERSGLPVMRPLLSQYPDDKNTFALDNQYLLGDKLLVRPVLHKDVSTVDVYFPSKNNGKDSDLWYDIDDNRKIEKSGVQNVPVDDHKVCVKIQLKIKYNV